MRFFESRYQIRIAEHRGVSQMYVTSILAKTLNSLRKKILRDQERLDSAAVRDCTLVYRAMAKLMMPRPDTTRRATS